MRNIIARAHGFGERTNEQVKRGKTASSEGVHRKSTKWDGGVERVRARERLLEVRDANSRAENEINFFMHHLFLLRLHNTELLVASVGRKFTIYYHWRVYANVAHVADSNT